MYKFIGKKGQMYVLDYDLFLMKLNYKCDLGTVESDSFKCGNTPEEAKKNYQQQQKEKGKLTKDVGISTQTIKTVKDYKSASPEAKLKFLDSEIAKGKKSTSLPDGTYINNIKGKASQLRKVVSSDTQKNIKSPKITDTNQLVTKTKSIIEKVKKEKASGKVSKETKKELEKAVSDLKNKKSDKTVLSDSTSTKQKDDILSKTSNTNIKPNSISEFISSSDQLIYNDKKSVDSLKEYISSSFRMNTFLRTKPAGAKVRDKNITALTETLDKSEVPKGTVLFRGVSPIQWETLPKEAGTTYTDKNFVSTTADEKIGLGFGKYGFIQDVKKERLKNHEDYIKNGRFDFDKMKPYLLEIRVNENTKGLSLEKFVDKEFPDDIWVVGGNGEIADEGNQREVLLQRSQKYRVVGTKEYKDHTRLIIETYNE
jgi:hypothetical protein